MDKPYRVVEAEGEIDKGLSYAQWQALEQAAVKTPEELYGIAPQGRDLSFVGVRYSIFDKLDVGDSVFIPAAYGITHTQSAAAGKGRRSSMSLVSRKTFEGGKWGVRIFRLA